MFYPLALVGESAIRIEVLGPFAVINAHGPVRIKSKKQRLILVALVLADGEIVSRDALIDGLWPAGAPQGVEGTLNSYVSGLRRLLEPDLASAAESVLETAAPGYRLTADVSAVDLWEFELMRAEAEDEAGLAHALGLVRGTPLAGHRNEELVARHANRLDESIVRTRERRLEFAVAAGRHRECLGELGELVEAHPLREDLRGLLMLALYRCGRQADALRCFAEGRSVLLDELGLEPSRQLVDLEHRILDQDPSLLLEASAPMPSSRTAVPDRASAPIAEPPRLIGRESELAALRRATELGGSTRLALVCGPAGIGKTALVQRLVHDLRQQAVVVSTTDLRADAQLGDDDVLGGHVVVIEDLHLRGEQGLVALGRYLAEQPAVPGLVIAACRTDSADMGADATQALGRISAHPMVRRVDVGELSSTEIGELLEPLGVDLDPFTIGRLGARTDGNPFYLLELARSATALGASLADAPLTDALAVAVSERLQGLPDEVREVLVVSSLSEGTIAATVDAAVLDRDVEEIEDAYDSAIEAGVLMPDDDWDGNVRFVGELLRDAIYRSIAPRRRARLHAAVGRAIEHDAQPTPERFAGLLARHYLAGARCDAEAIAWSRTAAEQASARGDHEQALLFRTAAYERLTRLGQVGDAVTDARLAMAVAARNSGEIAIATEAFLAGYAEARAAHDPLVMTRTALDFSQGQGTGFGRSWWRPGRVALDALDECLGLIGDEHAELRARLLVRRAADGFDLDADQRVALVAEARALFDEIDPGVALELAPPMMLARWDALSPAEFVAETDELVVQADESHEVVVAQILRSLNVAASLALGNGDDTDERLADLESRALRAGLGDESRGPSTSAPMIALMRGDVDGATATYERLAASLSRRHPLAVVAALCLACCGWIRGELDQFSGSLAAAGDADVASIKVMVAFIIAESGEIDFARQLYDQIDPVQLQADEGLGYWGLLGFALAQLGPILDDPVITASGVARLEPLRGHVVVPGPCQLAIGPTDLARATGLVHLDRVEEAAQVLDELEPILTGLDAPLWLAEATVVRADIARMAGDVEAAIAMLDDVANAAIERGAKRLAWRADAVRARCETSRR